MTAQNRYMTAAAKTEKVKYDHLTLGRLARIAIRSVGVLERIAVKEVNISILDHAHRLQDAILAAKSGAASRG